MKRFIMGLAGSLLVASGLSGCIVAPPPRPVAAYRPPPVYYRPPPRVYYRPPPVYYRPPPPGVSVGVHIN